MCLWRQGDGIVLWWTWEVSLHGPALDPVSEINSWKLALQKPDAGPQRRCADLTRLQRRERITLSLFFSTAKRKYFILAHLERWPTLNIALLQPSRSRMVDTCQRLQVRKSDILHAGAALSPFQGCCQREAPPFAYANKDVYMDWQVYVGEW